MISCLFFLFLVFSVPSAYSADNTSARAAFEEGLRLKTEGNLLEAERRIKEALQLEPGEPNYHFELANVYAMRYDSLKNSRADDPTRQALEAAGRELEQALMLAPDFTAARFNLGVVRKRQGKFEEARGEFKRILETDPNQIQALMQTGYTYEEQGFFDEAESYYRQALEKDVTNPGIRAALDDLERRRQEKGDRHEVQSMPVPFFGGRFRNGFPYSPYSQAAQYEAGRQTERSQTQGLQQAIPYLGAWLIQEFMKRKANSESAS